MKKNMSFSATQPFNPSPLPPGIDLGRKEIFEMLLKARTEIAELRGYTMSLPNPLLLLSPLILRESVASSGVENIHTSVAAVLQMQLFPEGERRQPDKEVIHYREALMEGFSKLKSLPISTRLILAIHRRLLPEGEGQYRRVQNQIRNWETGQVVFTPPEPQIVLNLMSEWEKFVNTESVKLDVLIRCAMAHYQFEAIHPFKDGNGRTGRIIMVLQLVQENVMDLPILFVSGYLLHHRKRYYDLLLNVSRKGEWLPFLLFMVQAFESQARETKQTLFDIQALRRDFVAKLERSHSRIHSTALADTLFSFPVITPTRLAQELEIHRTTASRYLNEMAFGGLLKLSAVGKYRMYVNEPLVQRLSE